MKDNGYFEYQSLTFSPRIDNLDLDKNQRGIRPMTILIGALSDGGECVILLADKTTTIQQQGLVFGHAIKAYHLTSKALVLTSGAPSNYIFLDYVRPQLNENMTLNQIAERVANGYRFFRIQKIVSEILSLKGFTSFDDFHNKQKYLDISIIREIDIQATIYNINVDLILGGFDTQGHIFHIFHPGSYTLDDEPGVYCAGYGATRAMPVFEFFNYSKDMDFKKVLNIAFIAKKRSEALMGIGQETDIWKISKSGIEEIGADNKKTLERNYKEKKPKIDGLIGSLLAETKEEPVAQKEVGELDELKEKPCDKPVSR